MKKKLLIIVLAAVILAAGVAAFLLFGNADPHKDELILYLPFDEGKGVTVADASGNLPEAEIDYGLNPAVYQSADQAGKLGGRTDAKCNDTQSRYRSIP